MKKQLAPLIVFITSGCLSPPSAPCSSSKDCQCCVSVMASESDDVVALRSSLQETLATKSAATFRVMLFTAPADELIELLQSGSEIAPLVAMSHGDQVRLECRDLSELFLAFANCRDIENLSSSRVVIADGKSATISLPSKWPTSLSVKIRPSEIDNDKCKVDVTTLGHQALLASNRAFSGTGGSVTRQEVFSIGAASAQMKRIDGTESAMLIVVQLIEIRPPQIKK